MFVDVARPAEFTDYLELERKKFKKRDFRTTSTDFDQYQDIPNNQYSEGRHNGGSDAFATFVYSKYVQ